MSEEEEIVVKIDGQQYDISKFNHPGDGICGVRLRDYHGKDVSKLMDHYHYTNQPFEMLEKANQGDQTQGIKKVNSDH